MTLRGNMVYNLVDDRTCVTSGRMSSSKPGTASCTGLLLKDIKALAALGVSGKRQVMSSCRRAPHECPMPTTGNAPYSAARGTAACSKRLRIPSQTCCRKHEIYRRYEITRIRMQLSINPTSTRARLRILESGEGVGKVSCVYFPLFWLSDRR